MQFSFSDQCFNCESEHVSNVSVLFDAVQKMKRSLHRVKMMTMTGGGLMMIFWGKLPAFRVALIVILGTMSW